ncbi:MAG TPA: penicillin acylase family protein [Thermoanaerobaculia bacterium]
MLSHRARHLALGPLWLLTLVAAVAVVLVVRNRPDRETPKIPGLEGPATVALDDRGMAAVTAENVDDAIRVQGYLTARERMFQLEVMRRVAAGELAELFGSAALPVDRTHRTYGFARVAAAAVPLLPVAERAHLVALADGINAFLRSHDGRAGLEFTLLHTTPRPWTPADSLRVLLLMYEDLTTPWKTEMAAERLNAVPLQLRAFLIRHGTRHDPLLIPDVEPRLFPTLPDLGGKTLAANFALSAGDEAEPDLHGSNSWAVSGALTRSGQPMVANDPHLGIEMPGIWLPMRFRIAGRTAEGVSLPGMPGIVIGRNDGMAWAFTNLMADLADLYREEIVDGKAVRKNGSEPVLSRVETIAVRGGGPDGWEVRETSHGPLVTKNLALKWTALDPRNLRLPTVEVMLASDPSSFDKAFDGFFGPSQNVVWASKDGHIGWRATGLLPIRRPGTDGAVPYDGRDPENDWRGTVPTESLPRLIDPPEGFIVTANQRTIGSSFPWVVTNDWASPERANRIRALIESAKGAGRKLDREAIEAIQMDVVSEPLRTFVALVAPWLPPDLAPSFAGWDGKADPASREFLVARAIRRKFRESALAAWKVRGFSRWADEEAWLELATAGDGAFRRTGLGPKDAFMRKAVSEALADIERRFGKDRSRWRWGNANRLAAHHPLGRIPGLSWLFDPPAEPQSGSSSCVKASSPAFGQSMRFVFDWGDPAAATLVVPFGVSGHLSSAHRTDQLKAWLHGDPGGAATRLTQPPVGQPLLFR